METWSLPDTGSLAISHHQLKPNGTEASARIFWVSYLVSGSQSFGPFFIAFPGQRQGAVWKDDYSGYKPAPVWETSHGRQRICWFIDSASPQTLINGSAACDVNPCWCDLNGTNSSQICISPNTHSMSHLLSLSHTHTHACTNNGLMPTIF